MSDKDEPTDEQLRRLKEYEAMVLAEAAFYKGKGSMPVLVQYSLDKAPRDLFLYALNEVAPEVVESLRTEVWPIHQEAAEKLDEDALRGVMPRPLRDYADLAACAPRQAPLWLLQQALLAWGDRWRLSPRYWRGDPAWLLHSALKFLEVVHEGGKPMGLFTGTSLSPGPGIDARDFWLPYTFTCKWNPFFETRGGARQRILAEFGAFLDDAMRTDAPGEPWDIRKYEHYKWLVCRHVQGWAWEKITETYRPTKSEKNPRRTIERGVRRAAVLTGLRLRTGEPGRPPKNSKIRH